MYYTRAQSVEQKWGQVSGTLYPPHKSSRAGISPPSGTVFSLLTTRKILPLPGNIRSAYPKVPFSQTRMTTMPEILLKSITFGFHKHSFPAKSKPEKKAKYNVTSDCSGCKPRLAAIPALTPFFPIQIPADTHPVRPWSKQKAPMTPTLVEGMRPQPEYDLNVDMCRAIPARCSPCLDQSLGQGIPSPEGCFWTKWHPKECVACHWRW